MQTACHGFMKELGVLKRGRRYFRKIPDNVGVQVRLSRREPVCSQIVTVDFW